MTRNTRMASLYGIPRSVSMATLWTMGTDIVAQQKIVATLSHATTVDAGRDCRTVARRAGARRARR